MAEIYFQGRFDNNNEPSSEGYTLSGSGLGFFGSTAGSSVQIGSYQDSTFVSNADGSTTALNMNNIKYKNYDASDTTKTYPSGQILVNADGGGSVEMHLSGIKSNAATMGIEFGHTTAVKVQNAQLRIYDRTNINYPATGVNTKVAEIINHNGLSTLGRSLTGTGAGNGLGSLGSNSATSHSAGAFGSGDLWFWGDPWPAEFVSNSLSSTVSAKYTNSSGEEFLNGVGTSAVADLCNGDSRLTSTAAGSRSTVGGTGIVVPLTDSPGSGQRLLNVASIANTSPADKKPGMMQPKWTQYVNTAKYSALSSTFGSFNDGANADHIGKTQGGTGVDTHHSWHVALSATPLSIGSKESYGLYVSLEYL